MGHVKGGIVCTCEKCNIESLHKRQVNVESLCYRAFGIRGGLTNWRKRYVLLISFLWALVLGPWAGFLASCCLVDPSYYFVTAVTGLYFVVTLFTVIFSDNIFAGALWLVSGGVWLASNWYKYNSRIWGSDLEKYHTIIMVSTALWIGTIGVPLVLANLAWCLSDKDDNEDNSNNNSNNNNAARSQSHSRNNIKTRA